jgi:predicted HD phosphohydrolase
MYEREETEYYRAKQKAARKLQRGWVKPADLPSNAEIRDEILKMAVMIEGEDRTANLFAMRLAALSLMIKLQRFRPRIIGSVLTGHVRTGSDIDLHLFSNSVQSLVAELEFHNLVGHVTQKRVRKDGQETVYRHIHLYDRFPFELTVYPESKLSYAFKSSITGKAIERASIPQFREFLARQYPDRDIDAELNRVDQSVDRFQLYESLLLPLENVQQHRAYHPEGDVLYHSLQVFDLACNRLPYDEEFLLAALLHDVGKGIDPTLHVQSGLQALTGYITERTQWLIANHMLAQKILDNTIGSRKHRSLQTNESYEELVMLAECDRDGRQPGVPTSSLDDALDYIRDLATTYG